MSSSLRFKTFTFRNFLSVGNKEINIPISGCLASVCGTNGVGKSSLFLDAIFFNLFGKPYRKIKLSDIPNRKNKKDVYSYSSFDVDGVNYEIIRTKGPDSLVLFKDGAKQEQMSSKGMSQMYIDGILGADYDFFRKIISLSINQTVPFFKLDAKDKRAMIDRVCTTTSFAEMLKSAKKQLSDMRIETTTVSSVVDVYKNNLVSLRNRLAEMTAMLTRIESEKDSEILYISNQITDCDNTISDVKRQIEAVDVLISDFKVIDTDPLYKQLRSLDSDISVKRFDVKQKRDRIKFITDHDECPTCGHGIDSHSKCNETESLSLEITHINEEVDELTVMSTSINNDICDASNHNNALSELKLDRRTLIAKLEADEKEMARLLRSKTMVESRTVDKMQLRSIKSESKQQKELYDAENYKLEELRSRTVLYKKIEEVLSDTGIKSYIFDKIVPVLNMHVNEYLRYFKMNIILEFDNTLNETITTIGQGNRVVPYDAFSEGEKKRIDLSILLTFIKLTKHMANWNCNILVIDELLDTSMDDEGILSALTALSELDKDMTTFIISHKLTEEMKSKFDRTITIYKNSNEFTELIDSYNGNIDG